MKNSIGSKSRLITGISLFFVLLGFMNGCTKSTMYNTPSGNNMGTKGGSTPGANEVWIQGMAFNPSTITIAANTTIIWTNKDAITHTVTSDAALFDSGSIGPNTTYSHTFATAGTFTYHCKVHPTMTASVTAN
jgi:plastocyanin